MIIETNDWIIHSYCPIILDMETQTNKHNLGATKMRKELHLTINHDNGQWAIRDKYSLDVVLTGETPAIAKSLNFEGLEMEIMDADESINNLVRIDGYFFDKEFNLTTATLVVNYTI